MNADDRAHRALRRRLGRALLAAGGLSALSSLSLAAARRPIKPAPSPAPSKPGRIAAPLYGTEPFLRSLWQFGVLPAVSAFQVEAEALVQRLKSAALPGVDAEAALRGARPAWIATLQAWLRMTAVSMGPLIDRRSLRTQDFDPPRPEMIRRFIPTALAAPLDATAMELVGSPAKGLPALELLLWSSPTEFAREPALFNYLVSIAQDLVNEAQYLEQGWRSRIALEINSTTLHEGVTEFINQLVGAVELLRWRDIERPVMARGARSDGYPRARSGQTALAWSTTWQTLRLWCQTPAEPPEPGLGLVPVALYLRSLGKTGLADRLDAGVLQADRAMQQLRPQDPAGRQMAASRSLAQLRSLIETDVAAALGVHIGFSDNDGD